MLATRHSGEAVSAGVYPTRNLKRLLQHLSAHPQACLLDIGPLSGPNIQWLIQRGCKTYVEDCFQTLNGIGTASEEGKPLPWIFKIEEAARQFPDRFDAILIWDFLDYLKVEQAREAVCKMAPLLKPKGLIFALFNFNPAAPSRPFRYRIVSEAQLEYRPAPGARSQRGIHQNRDIEEIFTGFEIINSCLLKHQMREVLTGKTS